MELLRREKIVSLFWVTVIYTVQICAQGWSFFGPDSEQWRDVEQIDGSFHQDKLPRIAAATSAGIVAWTHDKWNYVLPNQPFVFPVSLTYFQVYFSPWNDSVGFIKADRFVEKYPNCYFATIQNTFVDTGWSGRYAVACGYYTYYGIIAFPFHDTSRVSILAFFGMSTSTDNGRTWIDIMGLPKRIFEPCFLSYDLTSDSVLYYGGQNYYEDSSGTSRSSLGIFRSTSEGSRWDSIAPLPAQFSTAQMQARGNTFILAGANASAGIGSSGIYRSTDQGATWKQELSSVNVNALIRDKLHPQRLYAATSSGIYMSHDEGKTWQIYNNTLPTKNLRDMVKDPYSDTFYVATDLGVFQVFDKVVSGVEDSRNQVPASFALYQNYPNPFNPSTSIEYQLPTVEYVRIGIYNVLGEEVTMLVNEKESPGSYVTHWDGSKYPSGLYFYKMKAGSFSETKKLLLLK
ncbi:MAG: T9SS type A sorting domain-containing protein [Ignavibacteria bacterium]|nr:T9SS type A sorting domain-containing protein [Ignavibacteria bacterium]MBI3766670.1 T9SS type A sorting domain-containing protein [Ignavibacteriales bacterium]